MTIKPCKLDFSSQGPKEFPKNRFGQEKTRFYGTNLFIFYYKNQYDQLQKAEKHWTKGNIAN